jgi:UDP-2,4-diacetamido-2,4,6-trideoxy-beta-L-altropyranose hydrolase
MKRVVFRADAGVAIGSGHVMRCLALSRVFSAVDWSVGFAATKETFDSVKAFASFNFKKLILAAGIEEEADLIAMRWPKGADVLIVDHYGRDKLFERACRGWAKRIVVIDDLADRAHDCDLLFDSNAMSDIPYRQKVPKTCRIFVGPSYALLDPAFARARPAALCRRDGRPVERVFVSFGQIDADNVTERALAALDAARFDGAVDIILGRAAPNLAAMETHVNDRVTLHIDISNVPELMSRADIAIGAAGATSWERCCLGLPSIVIRIADNQRFLGPLLAQSGAAIDLGPHNTVTDAEITDAIKSVLTDERKRRLMAEAASRLVDGEGTRRTFEEIGKTVI